MATEKTGLQKAKAVLKEFKKQFEAGATLDSLGYLKDELADAVATLEGEQSGKKEPAADAGKVKDKETDPPAPGKYDGFLKADVVAELEKRKMEHDPKEKKEDLLAILEASDKK